jgi:transposase
MTSTGSTSYIPSGIENGAEGENAANHALCAERKDSRRQSIESASLDSIYEYNAWRDLCWDKPDL